MIFVNLPTSDLPRAMAFWRALGTAANHGGAASGDPRDHGFMYQRSMTDPDGHLWELTHFAGT
jgi:predicted lactoylglutathione lyase